MAFHAPTLWLPEHAVLQLLVPTYWNIINDDRSSLRAGLKYGIFSSHWPSPLIFLPRWPNELMNSLNRRAHFTKTNSLTGTDQTKINLTFGKGEKGMGWGGGIQCSRKSEKEHGGGWEVETICLPRWSTWTLACASSKSSDSSAHPNEKGRMEEGNERVLPPCGTLLTAGQGQRSSCRLADNVHGPYQRWVKPPVSLRIQAANRGLCARGGMTFGKRWLKKEIW